MPSIFAIHASDANPVLESFRSAFSQDSDSISFLNVEETPAGELRSRIHEKSRGIDVCLIFSSSLLGRFLRPLSRPSEISRDGYLLANPLTFAIQLNVTRSSRSLSDLWRDLFRIVGAWPGGTLLRMDQERLDQYARDLAYALREFPPPWISFPNNLSRDTYFRNFYLRNFDVSVERAQRPEIIDTRVVELLFATSRAPVRAARVIDFTGDRADTLSFGACRVRVPEDHKIGQLELQKKTSWLQLRFRDEEADERRHFIVKGIRTFDQNDFCDVIKRYPSKTALIFVHGFNTSFTDSILRFAQIVWDMQFRNVPIVFSWPSAGGVLNYLYDRESALGARQWFQKLIHILRAEAEVDTIHIIAHSMGNFVVLEALSELARAGKLPKLSEIVMAAPDVDVDLYKILVPNIRPLTRGMTLYASANDKALGVSRGAAGRPRAGDVFNGSPILIPDIESIDVSAIGDEMFGLNHDVFADNRSLIDDIGRLVLRGERPPDQRSPQIRPVPEGVIPPQYWRYVP